MLCPNLGNENSDAVHIICSCGPQVPHPWIKPFLTDHAKRGANGLNIASYIYDVTQ